jgi:hypothetical protein
MSPPPDLDSLSTAELKALVLLARASDLECSVVTQRDEIARLKPPSGKGKRRRTGGDQTAQLR